MTDIGIFTISLDFELHWGVFDKRSRETRITCYDNTLKLIPRLLQAFSESNVHVTWATVGSLFVRDKDEWDAIKPSLLPSYQNKKNDAYNYIDVHGFLPEAHIAPEEVKMIENYIGHELATHTFSHYYCIEHGQTADQFDADLKACIKASDHLGVSKPVSIVFPRNQYNEQYLSVCYNNGIKVIRSNPDKWFWSAIRDEDTSLMRKLFRTGDTYLPIGGRMTYKLSSLKKQKNLPLQLPASRLLRSYDAKRTYLNKLRLNRILSEMTYAAKNKECYHLWWHPEQFGDYPEESMKDLFVILSHYTNLSKTYGMQSFNMKEYLDLIK